MDAVEQSWPIACERRTSVLDANRENAKAHCNCHDYDFENERLDHRNGGTRYAATALKMGLKYLRVSGDSATIRFNSVPGIMKEKTDTIKTRN